jgi:hypothetical protein
MMPFFQRMEASGVATAIAQSVWLTGGLSAVHLVGFTLLMGAALVSNLRLLGVLFPERPALDVARSVDRGVAVGLGISAATGVLLFAARASAAAGSGLFQLKMTLLVAAAAFHIGVHGPVLRRETAGTGALRATGAVGLVLWLAVALAGCAYILLE